MLSETDIDRPGEAKLAALPVAATAEVHVELVYKRTVDPASAEPRIAGLL